jgi:hypothetical protein
MRVRSVREGTGVHPICTGKADGDTGRVAGGAQGAGHREGRSACVEGGWGDAHPPEVLREPAARGAAR